MSAVSSDSPNPPRVFRLRDGRVLGGVCAGLPVIRGIGTTGLRILFVLAGLCGGIGVIVYLACWLVLPAVDEDPEAMGTRGLVLFAWGAGGLAAVVLIAVASAIVAVFGYGWVVAGLAAAALVVAFSPWGTRIPVAAALLTVGALTLPAAAVALSPFRLALSDGVTISRPATAAAVERTTFRGGFGTQLVDLRRTALPAGGTITVHVRGGLRRTILALPADRCIHLTVHYAVHPLLGQVATLLSGERQPPFRGVVVFGRVYGAGPGHLRGTVSTGGTGELALTVDFSSQGGGLFARDYPDALSPQTDPDWPGFPVTPEPYPNLKIEPQRLHAPILAAWRARHQSEVEDQQRVERLMPGPCAS